MRKRSLRLALKAKDLQEQGDRLALDLGAMTEAEFEQREYERGAVGFGEQPTLPFAARALQQREG